MESARDSIPTSGVGSENVPEKRSDVKTNRDDKENIMGILKNVKCREKGC